MLEKITLKHRALIALALMLIAGCALLTIWSYSLLAGIPTGVTVLGWDVAGQPIDHFAERLHDKIEQLAQTDIQLVLAEDIASQSETLPKLYTSTLGDEALPRHASTLGVDALPRTHTSTLAALGLQAHVERAIQAVASLKSGSMFERAKKRWQLRHTALDISFTMQEDTMTAVIHEHWAAVQTAQPTDAIRIITPRDEVTYQNEKTVTHIDIVRLRAQLREIASELFPVAGESGSLFQQTEQPYSVTLPDNAQPHDSKQQTPQQMPQQMPQQTTRRLVMPTMVIYPKVTVELLMQQGIERKIVEFTTFFRSSGAGRVHNIQETAATIHDRLMAPGEVFDFNEVVRQTEQRAGYRQAPVIVNGQFVPGIGGGICQVSSTLYNAVLRGGLEIVERKNHSLPVRYVPLGQDATFALGYINFKFRNDQNSHLLLRLETSATHITVKLFGNLPEGTSYHIYSEIDQVLNPPSKYVPNATLKRGTTKVLSSGKTGYVVSTYRQTKQNEAIIATEKISVDHYRPQPSLIAAHPSDIKKQRPEQRLSPQHYLLEDGVSGPISD